MSMSIHTNAVQMTALRSLSMAAEFTKSVESRLASGKTISTAYDDGASYATSLRIDTNVKAINAVNERLNATKDSIYRTTEAVSVMSGLTAEEHDRFYGTGSQEQDAGEVSRALEQDVGAHATEGEGEQPVVQVRDPLPPGQPQRHQDDHDAHHQEGQQGAQAPVISAGHSEIVTRGTPLAMQG